MARRPKTKRKASHSPAYNEHKGRSARRSRSMSAAGRDIGPLRRVHNTRRKGRCRRHFKRFCEEYFPDTFILAWSPDHLKAVAKIEQAVLHGGLFAFAMPRGSGKTSLAETAALWALLYGHRGFVPLIGASELHAQEMLNSIKAELEGNVRLAEDFPEVCQPIEALDGIANRCRGQMLDGERTHITWTATEVVLPMVRRSRASGGILKVAGITGRIRGMKFKRSDGTAVRPQLVILDDPQTDESARSLSQCATRERILAGAVLGMAGPGEKISGIMPCTVIQPADMADSILDREKHPDWNGERTKMVYSFPANESWWTRYGEVRADSLRQHGDLRDATALYKAERAIADEGGAVAWPERFNHDELSALQHAMNLKLRDERAFFAEYQNEPMPEGDDIERLTVEDVAGKLNGYSRAKVPASATTLTAFIDVHDDVLFWAVAAWEENFTGHVIDYGTFPDQSRAVFTLRDSKNTLRRIYPKKGVDGAILAGLEAQVSALLTTEWSREGGLMKVSRLLVDSRYKPGLVADVKRRIGGATMVMNQGVGVRAARKPLSMYVRHPGEVHGHYWYQPNVRRTGQYPHTRVDVNFWKRFVHQGLGTAIGDPGAIALWGKRAHRHLLFAEHVARSEKRVDVTGPYGLVSEWSQLPAQPDNHWFDCLVGCAAGAAMAGIKAPGAGPPARRRKKYSQEDLRKRRTV